MRLEELDKNFGPEEFDRNDIVFYDARKAPFKIYGLYEPQTEGVFRRMPKEVADTVNPGVSGLSENPSGGRIRFKTDSPFVAIHAQMPDPYMTDNTPLMAKSFSLYINNGSDSTFYRTFRYKIDKYMAGEGINSMVQMPPQEKKVLRDITIYMPNYAKVSDIFIGIQEGAQLLEGNTYSIENPVVFYGSSITQGGCASRAGNSYEDMLSRMFDFDYINLGFSGSARGEDTIAEYIAAMKMSMFVYDYDHNAPSVEHLADTHDKLFRKVRAAHPDMPIVFMSAPNFDGNWEVYTARRNLIYSNYVRAYEEGDRNVYFVDGERMFGFGGRDACTVDATHPNDLGMYRMAEAVAATIRGIYEKQYIQV